MKLIKKIIKKAALRFGVEIFSIPRKGQEWGRFSAYADYNPWNKDETFQETFDWIHGHTYVDMYCCYELWKLVEQCAKLKTGSLIEVGVWRGGTGALIARQASICGIKDKVYLCDNFTGAVKLDAKDAFHKGGEYADTSRRTAEELVFNKMKLDNVEILEGIFPDQTGTLIQDKQFRFCHIDTSVYQTDKDIAEWIWDKLVPGGMIVFGGYGFQNCAGTRMFVEEQMNRGDRITLYNLNGHAVVFKL